jgi:hypothetical protein
MIARVVQYPVHPVDPVQIRLLFASFVPLSFMSSVLSSCES